MARFEDIDLSRLPPPAAILDIDFESYLSARLADLTARLAAVGVEYDAGAVDQDALAILQQTDSFRETIVNVRINDAVKAVMLATAEGTDLENVAAEYHVSRKVITPADPATGAPAVMEKDDPLRRRAQLAWEGLSTAGPDGAYYFHSLDAHPDVLDVGIYGPEDGQPTPYVTPGQVLVSVLSSAGDGVPTPDVLAAVTARLNRREVRPLTDQVIVEPIQNVTYSVDAVVRVRPGSDGESIRSTAQARAEAYRDQRRKVGATIDRLALAAALFVPDASGAAIVESIAINSPTSDVIPGDRKAALCTGVTVAFEVADD